MKVSVIIPSYQGLFDLKRTVEACLAQETPWKYEVIVIDSGSCDGSKEWLNSRAKDIDKLVFVEIPTSEFGHGKTRNFGASLAKGECIAFITQDATPANKHWLVNLVEDLLSEPDSAGVFGRHEPYPQHSIIVKELITNHFKGFGMERRVYRMEDEEEYNGNVGLQQLLHFYSDNNSCMRKSVWEKIPYPDVAFAEDQLWAKIIIEAGYSKIYSHDAVVFHSHDFSIWDNYKRARTEAYYFMSLFGYNMKPLLSSVAKYTYSQSISDYKLLKKKYGPRAKFWRHFFLCASLNFGKICGHYFGSMHATNNQSFVLKKKGFSS